MWIIVPLLLILWLLGLLMSQTLGGLLHVLLLAAVVLMIYRLATGRRPSAGTPGTRSRTQRVPRS
ncbi:MAG TPA: lmo0937 family membrane protein [Thermoanaerobaculia bacterium]|nr:lmo0937 family membrane protein [Thermoanaerobaculia bacterium]